MKFDIILLDLSYFDLISRNLAKLKIISHKQSFYYYTKIKSCETFCLEKITNLSRNTSGILNELFSRHPATSIIKY